jgi:hypothetical protein
MAIVNERHAAAKPTQVDPKTGKPLPPRANSPSVEATTPDTNSSSGFFGSFWASKNKKKMAAMEAPPPNLKASAALSERESTEVEVISMFALHRSLEMILISHRASYYLLLQYCEAHDDRHGPEGHHVHSCSVRTLASMRRRLLTAVDTPRKACNASCLRTCTAMPS